MYNLLEYSGNYSMTSGSLWNYYRDEVNDNTTKNNLNNYKINHKKTTATRCFEYMTKTIVSTSTNNNRLDKEFVAPRKHLNSNKKC